MNSPKKIKQTEDSNAPVSTPVTALHFDISSQTLVTGDQNGLVSFLLIMKKYDIMCVVEFHG